MSVPKDFPISQLRKVSLYFRQEGTTNYAGLPTVHFIHESQLDVLLKATLELHYQPGFNPYSGFKAATLWEVRVEEFPGRSDTFWWARIRLRSEQRCSIIRLLVGCGYIRSLKLTRRRCTIRRCWKR